MARTKQTKALLAKKAAQGYSPAPHMLKGVQKKRHTGKDPTVTGHGIGKGSLGLVHSSHVEDGTGTEDEAEHEYDDAGGAHEDDASGGVAGDDDAGEESASDGDAGEEDAGEENAGEENAGEENAGEENAGEPDAGEENAGEADAGEPDAGEADAGEPDAGEPDAGEPDAGEPDAGEPDAGEPDAGEPDAGEPDAGESDAGEPDAGESDAGESDAGESDAGEAITATSGRGKKRPSGLKKKDPVTQATRGGIKKRKGVPKRKNTMTAEDRAYAPLKQIREQQRSTDMLLLSAPMVRLLKELLEHERPKMGFRMSKEAKMACSEAAQDFIVQLFQLANRLAIHGGRVTIMLKDLLCWYDLDKMNSGYHVDAPAGGYAAKLLRDSAQRIVEMCNDGTGSFEATAEEEIIEMEE